MKNFNLSEWSIDNRSLVYFVLGLVFIAGLWSYFQIGRSENPSFAWRLMLVEARWPGATLDETLQQLTERIERKVQESAYVDHVQSVTSAGRTSIQVLLQDAIAPASVPDAWYQVRKKLTDVRPTLPKGVIGPEANDEVGDTFGIIYGFTADGFSPRELRDYLERARSTLLHLPDIAKVEIFGAQEERIYLEFSLLRLSDLHIDPITLIRSLQAQNAITPAGTVETAHERFIVNVSGRLASEEDLRRINFVVDGRLIPLTDLAVVKRAYADPPASIFRVNGQPAIGLAMAMRDGGDILALGRNVLGAMTQILGHLPLGIEPVLITNQADVVQHGVSEFMQALFEAIAIVMAVGLLSLGVRGGTVVACCIPLVLASVFVAMHIGNIGLQRVSLGALIIALGLLVDDAIITVEAMITRIEEGWEKRKAAIYAYATTHFPMGTGTLVTIAAFLPVGMARSSAGEYTFSLFAVVAIALIASWFVAAIFAPLIGMALLREQQGHTRARSELGWIVRAFRFILVMAMRARWATVGLTLGLFAGSLFAMQLVPQQFFPASDRPELIVDLNLPQNHSIAETAATASQLDALLRDDPDVAHWSTYIGRAAVHFYLSLNPALANDFFAQLVVVAKDLKSREPLRARIEQALREKFPRHRLSYPKALGPTVGWPRNCACGPARRSVKSPMRLRKRSRAMRRSGNLNFDWTEPTRPV
jgi:multidrug efflux pump subunit AcrB